MVTLPAVVKGVKGRKLNGHGRVGDSSLFLACIGLISYNCLKCNQASWGAEVLSDLCRDFGAAPAIEPIDGLFVGLQEVKSWKNKKLHRHMVQTNDFPDCGIAVPLRVDSCIKCTFSGARHFGIVIGSWIIVSIHLIWGEREAEDTLNEITL